MAFKLSRIIPYLPAAGALIGAAQESTSVAGFARTGLERLSQQFATPGIVALPTSSQQQTQSNILTTARLQGGGTTAGIGSTLQQYAIPIGIAVGVVLLMRRRR